MQKVLHGVKVENIVLLLVVVAVAGWPHEQPGQI